MLSIALPAGSLERGTLELFEQAGLAVRRSGRASHGVVDDPRIERVTFLRPQEIAGYVASGVFDLGVTGSDWAEETAADVVTVSDLGFAKRASGSWRLVLAIPESDPVSDPKDLPDGIRVATQYPRLAAAYFAEIAVDARLIASRGATEAKVPAIADAIVDVVETGDSLRDNGLKEIGVLAAFSAILVTGRRAYADPAKRASLEALASRLDSVVRGREHVLLKACVPAEHLEAALSLLGEAAVYPQRGGAALVESVVSAVCAGTLIEVLRAAGADWVVEVPVLRFATKNHGGGAPVVRSTP